MKGFTPSADFSAFTKESKSEGNFAPLFDEIYSIGGGLYNIYFKMGVVMAIIGLISAGILWIWYAGNSRELPRIKDLIARICITLAIMVNLVGIVIIVANLGMDY